MDIDNSDIDNILSRFRTMNTNDKDHLITEFKRLSNTQLSTEGCCFYLDLAEWNLNTALWAYYEYENAAAAASASSALNQQQHQTSNLVNNSYQFETASSSSLYELPEMQFIVDVTIGEGESVQPNTNFIKTWRVKNSGTKRWPPNCKLMYVNGYNFTSSNSSSLTDSSFSNHSTTTDLIVDSPVSILVKELNPQETCDISISLKSPRQCGIYQCQYRMFTSLDQPFGDPIWLLLNVEEGGVLGITQQLNSVSMFGSNWLQNQQQQQQQQNSINSNNDNIFSKSPFRLDNNFNYLNQNGNSNTSNIESNNNSNAAEEKRPDFYDDMFS